MCRVLTENQRWLRLAKRKLLSQATLDGSTLLTSVLEERNKGSVEVFID